MIPNFLRTRGQPIFHYMAIANSKLLQHLTFWAMLFNQQCHNFHLCHLLWNECVIHIESEMCDSLMA